MTNGAYVVIREYASFAPAKCRFRLLPQTHTENEWGLSRLFRRRPRFVR